MKSMFFELLKKRRSIRKFEEKVLEKEEIALLAKSVLLSPASRKNNPWEFIIVDDKKKLEQLAKAKHGAALLANAPAAFVVCADPEKSDVWIEDCSVASAVLLYAARDLGLGACWVQIRNRFYKDDFAAMEYVKGILEIPENYVVEAIVGVGYPAEEKKAAEENELEFDKLYLNSFGTSYEM